MYRLYEMSLESLWKSLALAAVCGLFPLLATGAAAQQPQFGATVARVRVDVIVTDGAGNFIDDLRPEDFVVLEDGEPQRVVSLQLVDLAAGTVADLSPAANVPELPPAERAVAPEATSEASNANVAASDLSAVVMLVDFLGLDWKGKERFANAWSEYLAGTDRLAVPQAAYLIDQVGRLEELSPLTFDVERLRQAAQALRATPDVRKSAHERLLTEKGTERPDPSLLDAEERARSRATLEVLAQFCDSLAARRGRTALIWVTSEVLTTEGGPFAALGAAQQQATLLGAAQQGAGEGRFRSAANHSMGTESVPFAFLAPDPSVLELQEKLHEAANSANVSIYTIDPIPQTEWRSIGFDVQVHESAQADLLNSLEVQSSLDGLRDSLRQAATETGGRSFIGWSELDRVLAEIDEHRARFYLLTYAPPPPDGDGQYHNIEVRVLRPGASVRARQGYLDLSEQERERRTIEAALTLPGTVRDLSVTAKAYRTWSSDGTPRVQLATSIQGPAGEAGAGEAGAPLRTYEVHAAAGNEAGKLVDAVLMEVGAAAERAAGGAAGGGRPPVYFHDWALPPGEYDLRVVAEDTASGRLGATRLSVEVPEGTRAWRVGDPMLLVGPSEGPLAPVLDGTLRPGETTAVQVEVFGGQRPLLSGEIFDQEGGAHVARLPALRFEEGEGGVWRGALRFEAPSPGRYTLQVMVTDPPAGEHSVFRIPIEAVRRLGPSIPPGRPTGAPTGSSERRSPEVSELLSYLGRVAEIYRDTALSFVAEETVREIRYSYPAGFVSPRSVSYRRTPRRQRRVLEFDYIYGRPEAEGLAGESKRGLIDYRRPRGSDREDMTPAEIVERYHLAYLVARAYSWANVFLESNQPSYDYEIVGRETVLGRPAVAVRFRPIPPYQEGLNSWYGTAWFGRDSYQLLRVEAVEAEEYEQKARFEEALRTPSSDEGDYTFTTSTAVFSVERNGLRFPGEVTSNRSRYHVYSEDGERRYQEYRQFEITQSYDNYRFFSIRTEEEIRSVILGIRQEAPGVLPVP